MEKSSLLQKLSELKPYLKKEFFVKEIGVFGSFATNTFNQNSDIDILIELEKPIGWKFFSLEIYLEKVFGRKIDLVTKSAIKKQIKEQILSQVQFV